MLGMLFRMHKITGEVWDPERHAILVLKSTFCMQKPQMRPGTILTCYSGAKDTVLPAQIHTRGLGAIETCKSGAKQAVLFAQIHRLGLGPIETSHSNGKHAVLHAQNHR